MLEYFAAFTVLGYVLAESRGRREESLGAAGPFLAASVGGAALGLEALAAIQAGPGASLLRVVLATLSSLYGARLYHLQRDHVRWLLRDRAGGRPSSTAPSGSMRPVPESLLAATVPSPGR